MSPRPSDAKIRSSYLEQAQLSQTHRFLAVVLGTEADQPVKDLITPGLTCELDGRSIPLDQRGLPKLPAEPSQDIKIAGIEFAGTDPLLPLAWCEAQEPTAQMNALPVPHRLLSLKHRWHALGESPTKIAPPYLQIITNNFVMDWGTGAVRSYAELEDWLANTASTMSAARHDIARFDWSTIDNGRFQATFEFDWNGISQTGKRIDRMDVEILIPFHVANQE